MAALGGRTTGPEGRVRLATAAKAGIMRRRGAFPPHVGGRIAATSGGAVFSTRIVLTPGVNTILGREHGAAVYAAA